MKKQAEARLSRFLRALGTSAFVAFSAMVLSAQQVHAYWTAPPGLGTATQATTSMQPVVVSALAGGDDPASTLIPGGTADVVLRVTNPNPVAVRIYSVASDGAVFAGAGFPDCTTTGVTFTPPSSPPGPTVIVEADSSRLIHLPGAASMDNTSSSGCQGARFHVPVVLTARQ